MRVLNLPAMIDFYDRAVPESRGHATAINAIMGEEFASALFLNYASKENLSPSIASKICTQGTKKGKRLDRWIEVVESGKIVHYQTEIKNWSSHAFSGQRIPLDDSEKSLIPYRIRRWTVQFDLQSNTLRQETAKKVLTKMRALNSFAEIRPLIIFWDSLHPEGKPEPFFSVSINDSSFDRLWVFSMSTYIRNLIGQKVFEIEVNLPSTLERLNWLNLIYKKID